jgi:hypothetical protein
LKAARGPCISAGLKNIGGADGGIELARLPSELRGDSREAVVQQEFKMAVVKIETRFREINEGRSDATARGTALGSGAGQIAQFRFDRLQKLIEVNFAGCLLGGRERRVKRREAHGVLAPERERFFKESAHSDIASYI